MTLNNLESFFNLILLIERDEKVTTHCPSTSLRSVVPGQGITFFKLNRKGGWEWILKNRELNQEFILIILEQLL